jgi:hypothetical protein
VGWCVLVPWQGYRGLAHEHFFINCDAQNSRWSKLHTNRFTFHFSYLLGSLSPSTPQLGLRHSELATTFLLNNANAIRKRLPRRELVQGCVRMSSEKNSRASRSPSLPASLPKDPKDLKESKAKGKKRKDALEKPSLTKETPARGLPVAKKKAKTLVSQHEVVQTSKPQEIPSSIPSSCRVVPFPLRPSSASSIALSNGVSISSRDATQMKRITRTIVA